MNLTNDAWFGDTREPHLHHAVARLRAIETRRELIRAVNTGVSGHVSATGANLHVTPTFTREAFVATVPRLSRTTWWVAHGDLVTPGCAGALLGLFAARWRVSALRRRRGRSPG